jgi:hypothetical protein
MKQWIEPAEDLVPRLLRRQGHAALDVPDPADEARVHMITLGKGLRVVVEQAVGLAAGL